MKSKQLLNTSVKIYRSIVIISAKSFIFAMSILLKA